MYPAISMACESSRKGKDSQNPVPPLTQPEAVNEKGRLEIPKAPAYKARVNHLFCSENRNRALPARMSAQLQAAAPTGSERSDAATTSEPMPISQKGRAVNSSGARSHVQPP